jgi:hypothetical protein
MKVCIEFNLSEAGELHELSDALNGGTWRGIVVDLDNILRDRLKHHPDEWRDPWYQQIRDELLAAVTNCGLDLHEPTFNYSSPTSVGSHLGDKQAGDRRHNQSYGIYVDTKAPGMAEAIKALESTPIEPIVKDGSHI